MLTEEQVIETLGEFQSDIGELGYLNSGKKIGELLLKTEERVGGEDEGSHYHIVVSLEDKDGNKTYAMIVGYYSSYEGTEFDGGLEGCLTIVEPYMKQVRDWKQVK